ncbi:DNA-binding transcriptional regulator, LysR family [Saccharopolyspora antimicrobica]|uniref:DNA-binding transcriptional LysR family regulator n=1 Tax=Saccharopolyspora antimicrobica TaxID=455193 RepID=A0A1I4SL58_9PSEU|nr:LysR family transcriptional regulator [Saccharopolyspora antimicrobica]RKT87782.1 DNA-binding transcriptional LysR family regulator [Saccharopolyspora antimicrobica]SFM65023.1 DNA-binding transcriptional regulator, LysR family [Saccharopolyspora antimicrobica]
MIDLRRLQVLRVLRAEGTVTATARALHLTPSAVSQQLRLLSKEVGSELLRPEGRRVQLTPAAHILLAHADVIATEWEQTRADLAAHAAGAVGLVRVAGFATSFGSLLAPAAARLRDSHPRLEVQLRETDIDDSLRLLLAEQADLAVLPVAGAPPLDDPRFDQRVLLDDPQDVVVSADHPFAERDSVRLAETAHETWIAPHHDQFQLIEVACAAAGFAPRVAHRAAEWNSVLVMVAHGLGICLLPRLATTSPDHRVVRIPLRDKPVPSRSVLTCVRGGSRGQPAIAAVLRALEDVVRDRRGASGRG